MFCILHSIDCRMSAQQIAKELKELSKCLDLENLLSKEEETKTTQLKPDEEHSRPTLIIEVYLGPPRRTTIVANPTHLENQKLEKTEEMKLPTFADVLVNGPKKSSSPVPDV